MSHRSRTLYGRRLANKARSASALEIQTMDGTLIYNVLRRFSSYSRLNLSRFRVVRASTIGSGIVRCFLNDIFSVR
jgi:hypothetical protein